MPVIKKNEREGKKNSDSCTVFEYDLNDDEIEMNLVKIDGRYPEKNYSMNDTVKETFYVVEGKGIVNINGKNYNLDKDDVALVLPKQKYFFEGKLKMVLSCTPKWGIEQYHVEIK